jgi:hypothetical protein
MKSNSFVAAAFVTVGTLSWQQVECATGRLSEQQCGCVEPPHGVDFPNPPMPPQPNAASWTRITSTVAPHVALHRLGGNLGGWTSTPPSLILRPISESITPAIPEMCRDRATTCRQEIHRQAYGRGA